MLYYGMVTETQQEALALGAAQLDATQAQQDYAKMWDNPNGNQPEIVNNEAINLSHESTGHHTDLEEQKRDKAKKAERARELQELMREAFEKAAEAAAHRQIGVTHHLSITADDPNIIITKEMWEKAHDEGKKLVVAVDIKGEFTEPTAVNVTYADDLPPGAKADVVFKKEGLGEFGHINADPNRTITYTLELSKESVNKNTTVTQENGVIIIGNGMKACTSSCDYLTVAIGDASNMASQQTFTQYTLDDPEFVQMLEDMGVKPENIINKDVDKSPQEREAGREATILRVQQEKEGALTALQAIQQGKATEFKAQGTDSINYIDAEQIADAQALLSTLPPEIANGLKGSSGGQDIPPKNTMGFTPGADGKLAISDKKSLENAEKGTNPEGIS